jgi:hypothetical protein
MRSTRKAFDLLAAFDPARTPGDSTANRSALDTVPVDEDLLQRIASTPRLASLTAPLEAAPGSPHAPRRHRAVFAAAAVVGAAVIVIAAALVSGPASRSPHAAKPLASPPVAPARWQLTASLQGPQFQLATGNPDAIVGVVCSGAATCLLSTGYGLDFGGGGGMFVSHDDGHTWQASPLPAGMAITSLASCVSDSWCAAGGGLLDTATGDPAAKKPSRDPELMVTTDGGQRWIAHPVPLPVNVQQLPAYQSLPAETTYWPGEVDTVSCSAPGVCNVLGQAQVNNPSGSGLGDELVFLRTTDGGSHWASTTLPPLPSVTSYQLTEYPGEAETMSCPRARDCVVLASPYAPRTEATWRTTDGGVTWLEGSIAGAAPISPNLSCPTVDDCWTGPSFTVGNGQFLKSVDAGRTWSPVSVPVFSPLSTTPAGMGPNVSCSSANMCDVSLGDEGLAQTTDGGRTWLRVPLPAQVGAVLQVSCDGNGSCAAIANPATMTPASINQFNGGSLILTNQASHS